MSGLNLTQINILKDLANQYSDIPEQFLIEGLGRNPTLDEFASFIEFSVANIFGGMYGILREAKSPQEAETWLKHTLSVTSALIRTRGSDAMLKFDVTIKEVPNMLHKKQGAPEVVAKEPPKEAQPAPAAPAPQCQCQIDAQGRCAKCAGILAAYFEGIIQPFMKLVELAEPTKAMCPVCRPTQADYAMSLSMPALAKQDRPGRKISQEVLPSLGAMAQMMGAKEMPLTNKAYEDAVRGQAKS